MFIASAWRGSSGCFAALFPLNDWEKCLTQRREGAVDKFLDDDDDDRRRAKACQGAEAQGV
jgi:hypothetical protein